MTAPGSQTESAPRIALAAAVALLVHYFSHVDESEAWTQVLIWAGRYSPDWVRLAVVEALYQGRYKLISVEQILTIWQRRGKALCHFNREFEAIIAVPLSPELQTQLQTIESPEEHSLGSDLKSDLKTEPTPTIGPVPIALSSIPTLPLPPTEEPALSTSMPYSILDNFPALNQPLAGVSNFWQSWPVEDLELTQQPLPQPAQSISPPEPSSAIHQFRPAQDPSGFDRKLAQLAASS
jgi:hypothetical protein